MPRCKYRQRCSSSRGVAAPGSLTSIADHNRSAIADALGQTLEMTFVASTNSNQEMTDPNQIFISFYSNSPAHIHASPPTTNFF